MNKEVKKMIKLAEQAKLSSHTVNIMTHNLVVSESFDTSQIRTALNEATKCHCQLQELDNLVNGILPPPPG